MTLREMVSTNPAPERMKKFATCSRENYERMGDEGQSAVDKLSTAMATLAVIINDLKRLAKEHPEDQEVLEHLAQKTLWFTEMMFNSPADSLPGGGSMEDINKGDGW
jgi:hypothetical protein